MSASSSTALPTSLNITLAHAISYLTRPLILSYPATTIIKLQLLLEANLTALYAPTWVPQDPARGQGRRCLILSPNTLPPRPIYSACASAGVQWTDWIGLLSKGNELELFVDPARVAIRMGSKGAPVHTIWSDLSPAPIRGHKPSLSVTITPPSSTHSRNNSHKSLAQQLEDDMANDENELFAMLADEISVPTWQTPTHDNFPLSTLQPNNWHPSSQRSDHSFPSCDSPLSDISSSSSYSRSSSRSDYYFDGCSSPSSTSSPPSSRSGGHLASALLPPSHSPKSSSSLSRRERAAEAREATVVVDLSKTEVTPYDNGKVGVLTGGVMLGGGAAPKTSKTRPSSMIAIPPAYRQPTRA